MKWLEGMEKDGHEWDILCVQEVAMRNQEEEWKYEICDYSNMQSYWNDIAPWTPS